MGIIAKPAIVQLLLLRLDIRFRYTACQLSCTHASSYHDKYLHSMRTPQLLTMQAVKFQPKNLQAWNLLGLCQTSMGDIGDGIRAYQKVIDMQPDHREGWVNMAQARKEVRHCTSRRTHSHTSVHACA